MKTERIRTPKGSIEYREHGRGIPVLILHGGHSNCRDFISLRGLNREDFRVIVPSRPGYGNTEPDGFESARAAADLMIALLDALGLKKVGIYGISAGGPTAIELAAAYPDRTTTLVLASAVSGPWLQPGEEKYKVAKRFFTPKREKLIWGMVRTGFFLAPRFTARSFFTQFSKHSPDGLQREDIRLLKEQMKEYASGSGFIHDIEHRVDEKSLKNLHCPVLAVHSRNDNSVPCDMARKAAALIPDAELLIIDNLWGHMIWLGDDVKDALTMTADFIRNHSG